MSIPPLSTADLAHGKLAWRSAGQATPLVLLHGLGGSSKSWEFQYRNLGDTFRVVAWDCPGYGASDDLAGPTPCVDDYVASVLGLIDVLGFETVELLGHSMGGVIASRLAARQPARVNHLVLSCTSVGWGNSRHASRAAGYKKRLNELRTLTAAEFGAARGATMVADDCDPSIRAKVAGIASEARLSGYGMACHMLMNTDNTAGIRNLAVPTLVISADKDQIASATQADELVHVIAGCQRVIMRGVGHTPYIEDPATYNATLRRFLAS
jgi:pimeloyl-ACP methyl ester carboxylesterase